MNKLMMVMMLVGTKAGMDVVNGYVDKRNLLKKFKPQGGHLVGLALIWICFANFISLAGVELTMCSTTTTSRMRRKW